MNRCVSGPAIDEIATIAPPPLAGDRSARVLDAEERAGEVRVERGLPGRQLGGEHGAERAGARREHRDVQPADRLARDGNRVAHGGLVGDVARDGAHLDTARRLGTQRLRRAGELPLGAPGDRDRAAVAHEPLRGREADAAAAAGDERGHPCERQSRSRAHLIASALGGDATPAGRFSGAEVKKHS